MELSELVRAELVHAASSFLVNDGALAGGFDPKALHDARVDLRRARSTLRTFRNLLEPEWLRNAQAQISWYQGLLGAVRDVDVAIGRILLREECAADAAGCAALTSLLAIDRAAALRSLEAGRESPRHEAALRHLGELATDPPMRHRTLVEARDALPPLIERAWGNLREAARAARREPTEVALHSVRLRAKELRFAAELATGALGGEAASLAVAARRVQRRLGRHRDALAAERWLEGAASVLPAGRNLAGRLARDQHLLADALGEKWPKDVARVKRAWRELDRVLR